MSRVLAITSWCLLLLAEPIGAAAQRRLVIPPGREPEVSALVSEALARSGVDAPWSARIDQSVIAVELEPEGTAGLVVTVAHPDAPLPPGAGEELATGVAVTCAPPCSPSRWRALAGALATERDHRLDALWEVPSAPGHDEDRAREEASLRWLTQAALALLAVWLGWVAWHARRERPTRLHAALGALVAAFVVAALLVPPSLPVHNHLSFVLRADCAVDPLCDRDPAGPAWSPPAFHAYELLLAPWPYSLRSRAMVSLGLSALSLVLLFSFSRRLVERVGLPLAGPIALLAVAFTALHPVWLRLSVSATFWPLAVCLLTGAGLAALRATAPRERRGVERLADATAAAVMLALAALTNLAFLTVLPLLVLAPVAWSRLRPRWHALVAMGAAAALLAPHVPGLLDHFTGGSTPAGHLLDRSAVDVLLGPFVGHAYADPSITPLALIAFAALGLVRMVRAGARPWLPVLWVWLAWAWGLGSLTRELAIGYPTELVHAQPALPWLAFFAAVGAGWVATLLLARGPRRLVVWTALVAAPLASLPIATDALRFLGGTSVIAREARLLGDAFEALPPHEVLVVPPRILEPSDGVRWAEDPVESNFPAGDYRGAMRRAGRRPAEVLTLDRFVEGGPPAQGEGALVYLGSTLYTFDRNEMAAGVVPRDYSRPLLRRLHDRYRLEPVHTFQLETAQDPRIVMRLAADEVPAVEVGFYRLLPR